jgi:hypothetical protein
MSIQRLIDDVPSEEFFETFHYTRILEQLGLDSPSRTSGFIKCIKCKAPSMLVSGAVPFGAWFYCDTCKTSCDCVKLYGEAYKISNPEEILEQLKKDLKLKAVNKTEAALYCNFHDTYYSKVQLIWEKARANMAPQAATAAIGRLSELNMWISQEVFDRGLANCVGYMPKYKLEELLDDSIPGIAKNVEGVLVIPFYLKPGFICGFGFIGPKDNMSYMNMMTQHATGFCGLIDTNLNSAKEVYILEHPLQALRIKHKCAIERYNKLSVVAKGSVGDLDCTAIKGDPIVWVDVPDNAFFKTCILSRGFKVLAEETPYIWKPTEKNCTFWQSNLMPIIHKNIGECRLQNPVEYFISELLTLGLGKARIMLEGLNLSEFQKNMILSACPSEVKKDIEELLEHAVQSQPLVIDKKVFFEREGKLWVQGSREVADEMVCNLTMRIQHICRNKNTGFATMFGKIYLPEKEVSFQADEKDLEEQPKTVISTVLAVSGDSVQPYIAESVKKKYLDIVLRLSAPEVHTVQDYVGYDSDLNRFNLPLVSIDVEHLRVGMPFVICDEPIPCENVNMASGDNILSIKHLFKRSLETAAYMGGMACVISNIYNNIDQNSRTNTMFVGARGSLAEYVFDLIRIDLDLVSISLNTKKDMDLAKELAVKHDVPVAINGFKSNPSWLAQWLEGQGGNSIVLADSINAAALGSDKDWYFLRADVPLTGEPINLLNSEYAFPFLLQYMLTTRPSSADAFLNNLNAMAVSFGLNDNVTGLAQALISYRGLVNANSPAIHFMSLLLEGVEAGLFKTYTGESSKKSHIVIKNPLQDTVTVNVTNLLGQIRLLDLPSVNWNPAIDMLKELGAVEVDLDGKLGLMFPKPMWNYIVTAVKRMKTARKAFLNRL